MYLGHDLGTGSDKAVLVDRDGNLVGSHTAAYPLHRPRDGWVEQDPADWWRAVCESTRAVVAGRDPATVRAVCFAGQMLALVPMDEAGRPTRRAISWMDGRAGAEARRLVRRLGGPRVVHALAGGVPTGKDLVAKIAWIRAHEPSTWAGTAAFGDATSYLVARATGRVAVDPTAAGCTGVFDLQRRRWSPLLARLVGLPRDKLPPVLPSGAIAGRLGERAAAELGLAAGTPVAMGLSDIPAAALGSGAIGAGEAHVYLGTSAWIAMSTTRPLSLPRAGIASVPSGGPSGCLLIAESETAGACRDRAAEWLGAPPEALAAGAPPGSDGLLFCPWLAGERSPLPSAEVRGAFVNLGLSHGPAHLARAVLEGVALNLGWILAEIDTLGGRRPGLRAIGGGARSDLWLQILADIIGEPVTRMRDPQHAGAVGAALLGAVAVGDLGGLEDIARATRAERVFRPTPGSDAVYAPLGRSLRAMGAALRADARGRAR